MERFEKNQRNKTPAKAAAISDLMYSPICMAVLGDHGPDFPIPGARLDCCNSLFKSLCSTHI